MRLLWIAITSLAIPLAAASCGGLPEDTGDPVDRVDQDVAQAPAAGAAGQGTTKVTICHIPPGNPANAHSITVGAPAVRAHLAHGDSVGACGGGGGGCGGVGAACTATSQCCAGLTCVSDSMELCSGGQCSCQVVIN